MMLGTDINSLQQRKLDLEIELNNLLKSENKQEDKINELRSEILYLSKQIKQILGSKEVENQERIKRKKLGIEQRNIKNYNAFKSRYKKICKIEVSAKNILKLIDIYLNNDNNILDDELAVKVMSR